MSPSVRESDLALALFPLPRFMDTILVQVRVATTNDDQSNPLLFPVSERSRLMPQEKNNSSVLSL